MTIFEMFQRENIYEIIEKTMPFYYKKVFGKDVSVHIKKGSFFKKLLIYPRLGIIIPLFPSKKVRREVYSWFNVQHNWIKNVLAKLYIFLLKAPPWSHQGSVLPYSIPQKRISHPSGCQPSHCEAR